MDITSFVLGYQKGKASGGSGGGGTGGGSLPAGVYLSASPIKNPTTNRHKRFMFNGELYASCYPNTGSGNLRTIYKWNGTAWETLLTSSSASTDIAGGGMDSVNWNCAEFNGKLHMVDGKYHYVFDGENLVRTTDCTGASETTLCVWQGKLYLVDSHSSNTRGLYEWDDDSSAWNTVTTFSFYPGEGISYGDQLYCINGTTVYKYVDDTLTSWGNAPASMREYVCVGNELYCCNVNYGLGLTMWYQVNLETMEYTEIGTTPTFANIYPTLNTDELSFTGCTYTTNSNFPFFVVNIIEASE